MEDSFKFEFEDMDLSLIKEEILEKAFDNSYRVLVGDCTIAEAEYHESDEGDRIALFVYDPEEDPVLEDLVIMQLYFEKWEMYERCAELKKRIELLMGKEL